MGSLAIGAERQAVTGVLEGATVAYETEDQPSAYDTWVGGRTHTRIRTSETSRGRAKRSGASPVDRGGTEVRQPKVEIVDPATTEILVDQTFPFLMSFEPAFPLSEAERTVIASAPFRHTPDGCRKFALSIHDCVVVGYRQGEMTFRRMMQVMRARSLGCQENDRVELLALTADRALRAAPRDPNRSQPPYPRWQRRAAVELVLYLESLRPRLSSTTILEEALAWLRALGLATEQSARQRPLSERTLRRWVQEARKARGQAHPVGRPRG